MPAAVVAAAAAAAVAAGDSCRAPFFSLGCFADGGAHGDVFNYSAPAAAANMSYAYCVGLCCAGGFRSGSLAAVENGTACYCGGDMGPYPVPPEPDSDCAAARCAGSGEACGGDRRLLVLSIASCPNAGPAAQRRVPAPAPAATPPPPPGLQSCGAEGCTRCPAGDTCCVGHSPDPYRVKGGYGCAPPNTTNWPGCAGGGRGDFGCCCGPGPTELSGSLPNVLIVGDSVSAGYISSTRRALQGIANVQHGPDNAGGGNADGVGYGRLCVDYFIRTPQHELPRWDLITFNFGLHDGSDSNATYQEGLAEIADKLLAAQAGRKLLYFQTTIPGGAGSVPGEPTSPANARVRELNAFAAATMAARGIPVVDLYETMTQCGDPCKSCKPHCGADGYEYLTAHAIAPAIKRMLGV